MTVAYYRKPVVWDVSFDVPPGKLVGIVDPMVRAKVRC